jgi:hypothetical protein
MTRVSISSGVKRLGKRKTVGSNCATWGSFIYYEIHPVFSLLLKARLGKLNLYEKIPWLPLPKIQLDGLRNNELAAYHYTETGGGV